MSESFKFLTVIDPHASDKTPGSRVDNYTLAFFSKLEQIANIAQENSVHSILMTGDLFSDKEKGKNSHYLTSNFIRLLLNMPCKVYGILGNHDLYQNQFSSWESQPVSNLVKSGAYNLLDFGDYVHKFSNGKSVRIRGKSYNERENVNYIYEPRGDENLLVQVTHFSVSPEGGVYSKYAEKMYSYDEIIDSPVDIFVLGHIHNDYGVTQIKNKHFVQHGSLMRSSTHCYNLERSVKVGLVVVYDDMKIEITEIPLDILPSNDVFSLEKKNRIERETRRVEDFLAKLSDSKELLVDSGSGLSVLDLIEKMDLTSWEKEDIRTKYNYYMNLR